jgi:NAD(P)-dependent dehydrogenase (short-subunit alcohol dehydrogenase family)
MAEQHLQGKVTIVTGAASPIGLGHAMTEGLIRAGARVTLFDRNETWLEQSTADMRRVASEKAEMDISELLICWNIHNGGIAETGNED